MNKIVPITGKPSTRDKWRFAWHELSGQRRRLGQAALRSVACGFATVVGCAAMLTGISFLTSNSDENRISKAVDAKMDEIIKSGCTIEAMDGQNIKYTSHKFNLLPRPGSAELHVGINYDKLYGRHYVVTAIPVDDGRPVRVDYLSPVPEKQRILTCGLGEK